MTLFLADFSAEDDVNTRFFEWTRQKRRCQAVPFFLAEVSSGLMNLNHLRHSSAVR